MTWKQRALVSAFSVGVGLVLSLPSALMPLQRAFYRNHFPGYFNSWTNNGTFSLLESFHLDVDTYPYAARVHQAGTHPLPGDPHIKGNHSVRLIMRDFITFYSLGWLHRLVGEISTTWVVAQFLLSLLWVPCLYALMVGMGTEINLALFMAVVCTLFQDLTRLPMTLDLFQLMRTMAQYVFWVLGSYLYWFGPTRFTRPLFTYPCLFLASVLALRTEKRRTWGAAMLSGLAGGALLYVHPDIWGVYVGTMTLFTASLSWRERSLIRPLLASLAITVILSAPWILATVSGPEELHFIAQRARNLDYRALLYLAVASAAWMRYRANHMVLWCSLVLVTISLALNIQVVTGIQSYDPSLWWYLGNTFGTLLLGKLVLEKIRCQPATWRWLASGALLLAIPRATNYSILHYQLYAMPQAQEDALRWLDRNAPQDSVVAALNPITNYRISIYTHSKTLLSLLFPLTSDIAPLDNARRIMHALCIFGVESRKFVEGGLDSSGAWEKRLWLGEVDTESHDRSGSIARYFLDLSDPAQFLALLNKAANDPGPMDYEVDYVWLGSFEKQLMAPAVKLPNGSSLRRVFGNSSVTIYRLIR